MTKNTKLYLIGLVLIAAVSTTTVIAVGMLAPAPKPTPTPQPKTYEISAANNASTLNVKVGDIVRLTLKDFGDGGYTWSIKNNDIRMLALSSTLHTNGSGALGDFGSNVWTFKAIQPGSSSLDLVSARPWNTTDVCASFHIQVVIQ